MRSHAVTRLGTGLSGGFYTAALHAPRRRNRVGLAYSGREDRARVFAKRWGVPRHPTDLRAAIEDPSPDTVVIGRPNDPAPRRRYVAARSSDVGSSPCCTAVVRRPDGQSEAVGRILRQIDIVRP